MWSLYRLLICYICFEELVVYFLISGSHKLSQFELLIVKKSSNNQGYSDYRANHSNNYGYCSWTIFRFLNRFLNGSWIVIIIISIISIVLLIDSLVSYWNQIIIIIWITISIIVVIIVISIIAVIIISWSIVSCVATWN